MRWRRFSDGVTTGWSPFLVGVIAAAVSFAMTGKRVVGYLNRWGHRVFGWYRISEGIGVGILISTDIHGFASA